MRAPGPEGSPEGARAFSPGLLGRLVDLRPGEGAALLWSSDAANPIDLNANQAFAPASAWNVHATDLNDSGTVLTGYNDTAGNFFTFLLRPVP